MFAVIKVEAIGDDFVDVARSFGSRIPRRYWAAEIVGYDQKYKYKRIFLSGQPDYSEVNSKGSRGKYVYYVLESDKLYEIKSPISWKRSKQFFCTVSPIGKIIKLSEEELKSHLSFNDWFKVRHGR